MGTLEKEFKLTAMRHKGAILMAKIMEYYREQEECRHGVKIPDCVMVGMWQRQAYKDIQKYYCSQMVRTYSMLCMSMLGRVARIDCHEKMKEYYYDKV